MAQAIQDGLRDHGVKPALCKVGVCTAEEQDILEMARARLVEGSQNGKPTSVLGSRGNYSLIPPHHQHSSVN
jgi:hypothetical protein